MKKRIVSFLLLIGCTMLQAQHWSPLGPSEENQLSKNRVDYLASATDKFGALHAVFQDDRSEKLTVRKWTGTTWINIGPPKFTPGGASGCAMAFNQNNEPYVVFSNQDEANRISVMRLINNIWNYVGQTRISDGSAGYATIIVDSLNRPVIAFGDSGNDSKLYVKAFIQGAWQKVGSGAVSQDELDYGPYLVLDKDNHVIIAYRDYSSAHLHIKRFVNAAWQDISDTTILSPEDFSMAVKSNGDLFCAYRNGFNDTTALVLKVYTNGAWQNRPVRLQGDTIGMVTNIIFDDQDKLHIVNLAQNALKYYTYDGLNWQKHSRTSLNFTVFNYSLRLQNNNQPALFFQDVVQGNKALCRLYNGNAWPYLGTQGFSKNWVSDINAKSDYLGNVFSLMHKTYTYSRPSFGSYKRTELKKFDGVNWLTVGDSAHSLGNGGMSDLAIDTNGIPWVVAAPSKIRVSRLNQASNIWVDIKSTSLEFADVDEVNIEISSANTPFVCYSKQYSSDSIYVKKYVNNAWVRVGNSSLPEWGEFVKMVLDGENPVISLVNNSGFKVYKLVANTWVVQGNPAIFKPNSITAYDLGVYNSEIVISFPAAFSYQNISVKKYNGIQWSFVGEQEIASSGGLFPRMEFDDFGNIYILFRQFNGTLMVKKFDGTTWEEYGKRDFSECISDDFDISVFGNGTVAVVFDAGGAFAKAAGPSVGVDEEQMSLTNSVSVYPNPSSGLFVVDLLSESEAKFVVTTILGQAVLDDQLQGASTQIDLRNQASGIYILRFEDGLSIKLLKQ